MKLITHALAFFAGAFALAVFSSPRDGSVSLFSPAKVERTYYDAAKTQLHSEYEVDSQGLPHGEMTVYWPSGRKKETLYFSHGQTGRAGVSHDPRSDVEVEAREAAGEE